MTDSNKAGFGVLLDEWRRDFRQGWQEMPNKGLFLILLGVWVVLFQFLGNSTFGYKDTPSLFGWMNYSYNQLEDDRHCKYIPLVVLGLFWWKRKELMSVAKGHWWPAVALIVLGLVLHVLGFMVQQTRLSIAAFFVGLYGLTGLVWGQAWLKASFFPYFLLVFCVPLGTVADTLTFPLRMLVTKISVGIAQALGNDVVRQGSLIFDTGRTFQYDVAPACSGIRSLTALIALTTIYGFTSFKSLWKRGMILAAAIPLAVAGNVARITSILVVAQIFGNSAGLKMHDYGEFVFFAVAMVCIVLLGIWLGESDGKEAA